MADITSIISAPSDSGTGAANSTTSASPPPIPSNSGAGTANSATSTPSPSVSSAFVSFIAHLFPPHEGFNDDSISIYHQNEDDDADIDDDDDDAAVDDAVDEDEAINVMCTLTLSIKNCLQLAKAIVDRASENMHMMLVITASQMMAEIYRKVIAHTTVVVNSDKFHSEKDKQLEKNALENIIDIATLQQHSI
ncbi:predicted protein [Histoplasma capsulatum G186AR]|uniref:Uncharacterized protein n=1 Tax=Ajellomyces capsulatus (strain G186AR / H82 / ATCC MYA-2454 / RMSCC 2432) TaxID=447093 RepID=C0NGK4_AJECG|nr:uncharacterized protein HCBG_02476 [Histoplasma capsulatum G186AR]EEH08939.1 predicted protein [Histoplasma capsulatum G186AR]